MRPARRDAASSSSPRASPRSAARGSERKLATPASVLSRLGVEHVQDRADQQRMAGLLPVVAPLERAFGIDQDVGDVLDVAHLVRRRGAPRAAGCRRRSRGSVGSNSSTRPKRARQPAVSCQFSPLMSWTIAEPGQVSRRRHHEPDALAASGSARSRARAPDRRGGDSASLEPAEHHAVGREEAGARDSSPVAQRAEP